MQYNSDCVERKRLLEPPQDPARCTEKLPKKVNVTSTDTAICIIIFDVLLSMVAFDDVFTKEVS